jgi:hypothetical protein
LFSDNLDRFILTATPLEIGAMSRAREIIVDDLYRCTADS